MFLLFDIGGTKMRIAISKDGESFEETKIVSTPQDFQKGIQTLTQIGKELMNGEKIKAVAGGIAGPLDKEKTMLLNSPNIPGWANKPLKDELEKSFEAPLQLQNDMALVGMGEALYGAGKNHRIVVYMTISTGVGGSRIINGKLDENAMGFEPGHQIIDINSDELCGCGGKGHLEALIGGNALERRYGKKPAEISDPTVWEEVAKSLAHGLHDTIVHWSPDIIILGGPTILKEIGISLDRVQHHLKEIMTIFPEPPPLKKAELQDVGGLYGALALLKNQ